MKIFNLICCVFFLLIVSQSVFPQATVDFREYFTGQWDVELSSDTVGKNIDIFPSVFKLFFTQVKDNSNLLGITAKGEVDDNLSESDNSFLKVEFDDSSVDAEGKIVEGSTSSTGTFFISNLNAFFETEQSESSQDDESVELDQEDSFDEDNFDEEEEEEEEEEELEEVNVEVGASTDSSSTGQSDAIYQKIVSENVDAENQLFQFDFQRYLSETYSSSGKWTLANGKQASYQLIVFDSVRFMLQVFMPQEESSSPQIVHTFVAKKFIPKPEQTFFQKYSMPIMIGVFMIVRMFLQSRQSAAPVPQNDPQNPDDANQIENNDGGASDNVVTDNEPSPNQDAADHAKLD